jgi:hypothetical protein
MRIVMTDWAYADLAKVIVVASVPAEAAARNWRREMEFMVYLLGVVAPSMLSIETRRNQIL